MVCIPVIAIEFLSEVQMTQFMTCRHYDEMIYDFRRASNASQWSHVELGTYLAARENIHYDFPDVQVRLD